MDNKILIRSLLIVYIAMCNYSFAQTTDTVTNAVLNDTATNADTSKKTVLLSTFRNTPLNDSSNCTTDTCCKIRIMCVGDIMTHFPQINAAKVDKKGTYDFTSQFEIVSPLLKKADLVIGNLETVLAGDQFGFSGYPEFNGPQALATSLKKSGFTVLTTANNHAFDQNVKGLKNTLQLLDSINILHTGTFSDDSTSTRSLIVPVKGVTIGILSYTYGTNSELSDHLQRYINIIDTVSILNEINYLHSKNVSIIIASMHFGIEYSSQPSNEQKRIVDFLWRNNVSIVFGHHPHVLQPAVFDSLNNKYVVFSLGNFLSNQFGDNREFGGICDITISNCGDNSSFRIEKAVVHPTCVYHWFGSGRKHYTVLPLDNLSECKLFVKNSRYRVKLEDTLKYFEHLLHNFDRNFIYGRSSKKSFTSDSGR